MPQWNCSCPNCRLARAGKIPARTQACAAISADGESWFLINASPDLRAQIESFPALQPRPETTRNTPISGVLLTNADLDHVLGLFLLREAGQLRLIAPRAVLDVLARDLRFNEIVRPFCAIEVSEPPLDVLAPLPGSIGLRFSAIPLSAQPPPFSTVGAEAGTQSVAYEIVDTRTGGRLIVAPDVAVISHGLQSALNSADAVLFDGTFWSEDEFPKATGKPRTAADMGHLTIGAGSLNVLRPLRARHKIYLHINNTNPILGPGTAERSAVESAGIRVGEDGMEFEL